MKEASTPEAAAEALRYGLKVGAITEDALRLAVTEASQAQKPQTAHGEKAPAPAAGGAAQPAQPAQPNAAQPLIMGQPAAQVQAAAEKLHFAATQLQAWGLAAGWGAVTPEPIKLFQGTEFEFECKGDPRTRLVELGAVELARMQGGSGGAGASTFERRVELGALAVAAFGPGLFGLYGPVSRAVGGVVDRAARVGAFIVGQVRGLRR